MSQSQQINKHTILSNKDVHSILLELTRYYEEYPDEMEEKIYLINACIELCRFKNALLKGERDSASLL